MNRADFMAGLSCLLADITDAEREAALNYYEDYFDDAGWENEESVIKSLGSPEKVAEVIKAGLKEGSEDSGEFTENGYSNYTCEKDEVIIKNDGYNGKRKLNGSTLILVIILCVFALPILGPLVIAIVSLLFSILCTIAALLLSVVVGGFAISVAGVALIISGVATIVGLPVVGILLGGAGLILMGLGNLIIMLGVWLIKKVVPAAIRGFVKLCRMPFERKGDK